jgi:hypothetical protein
LDPHETIETVEHAVHDPGYRRSAMLVAALAACLALSSLAANSAATEAILSQTQASDGWNEFQANSLKRHVNEDTSATLRLLAPTSADAKAKAAELDKAVADKYRPSQDRLAEKARHLEAERDDAERRHHGYQLAEGAFQLAIVLASASILAASRFLLLGGAALGVLGVALVLRVLLGY